MEHREPSHGIAGIVDRVLTFIDQPWKAVTVIIMLVLGGAGWFLYNERARIADAILSKSVEPTLEIGTFTEDAPHLLQELKADAVLLMSINLVENQAQDRIGFDDRGQIWTPVHGRQLALYANTPMIVLLRLLNNAVLCTNISANSIFEEFRAQAALGVKRVCIVAVPPIVSVMVGLLVVSWRHPSLSEIEEAKAEGIMLSRAMKYATW